jgi:HYR domain/Secretion system C-terminal sorting domain
MLNFVYSKNKNYFCQFNFLFLNKKQYTMKATITSLLLTFFLCPIFVVAQLPNVNQAVLIQDVVAGAQGSNPRSFVQFNNNVYFLLRRTPPSALQLNQTQLTTVTPVTIQYSNPLPDSIVSDVVITNGFATATQLWFFTKRRDNLITNPPVFELRNFNGSTNSSVNAISNFGSTDYATSVTKIRGAINSNVYAEFKTNNANATEYYTNMAVLGGINWRDTLDRDYLGNAMIFKVSGGTFFTRNIKSRPDEDKVEYRDDNGSPSSYRCVDNQPTCPKILMGIAADSDKLLYYSKIGNSNQLWLYKHIRNPSTTFTKDSVTGSLFLEIGKPGIFHKGKMYFKTLNEGLWMYDTIRTIGLKAVKGFRYTSPADSVLYPVDSLSLAAGRAFFWAKTRLVPSGGIYEISNDSAIILRTLNTNERVLDFIELDGKPYVVTREGAISILYRINSNSLTEIGKVTGIDILAGYASLTNTFVYSGNNNDGRGQEPYKISLISPCDTDINPPTFTTCPTDMTKAQTTACGVVVNWTEPTAIDNCSPPSVKQTAGLLNGACFPVGISTVTYTATDTSRRTVPCTFRITVTANPCSADQTPPVFTSCPTNISVTQNSACGAIATWQTPIATDNCGAPTVTQTTGQSASGACFPVGTTAISYTAKDGNNLTAACAFSVIVAANPCTVDQTPPTFTNCPANISVTQNSACGAIVTWQIPLATDNCGAPAVTQTTGQPVSGACFPVGTTAISYTAKDGNNLTATCGFSVIITANPCSVDQTPPTFTNCPANISVTQNSACGAIAIWQIPTATDNCTTPSVTQTTGQPVSGACFPVGTTAITYTAKDANNLTASCAFSVIVTANPCTVDQIPPTFTTCPVNISVTQNSACGAIASWQTPIATDNCSNPTVTQTAGQPMSGACFPVGSTAINYTAKDASNLTATCGFSIIVTANPCSVDQTPPTFTNCPANISVTQNNACGAIAVWLTPSATDNCSTPTVTQVAGQPSIGSCFPVGSTVITYTAKDANNLTSTCTFNVVVAANPCSVDQTPPRFTTCPVNITLAQNNTCGAIATWQTPTATDNCSNPTVTQTAGQSASGACFPVGTTAISYTAKDANNLTATCTFNIVVSSNPCSVDQTPPVFTACPANITVAQNATCGAIATWQAPTATDNCGNPLVTQTAGQPASGACFPVGTTVITYVAKDANNLTTTCTFSVIVNSNPCTVDQTPPTFAICPANITLTQNSACGIIATWQTPTATDNCGNPSVTQTAGQPVSGACFPVGTTVISYTAKDASNLTATCTFNVIVTANPCSVDQTPPVFTSCPVNIALTQNAACGAIATWQTPIATDNCGNPSVTQTAGQRTSGTCFPVGTTAISYTAKDVNNLTATCAFNVVVTANPCTSDQTPPTFTTCPTNITVAQNSPCGAIVTWQTPIATDNCSTPSVIQTTGQPISGTCFPVGTTVITYTAKDATNLTATCTFNVIITANPCTIDLTPPIFTSCPANISISQNSACGAIATWQTPLATDNCSTPTVTQTAGQLPSGACFSIGTTAITYTAKDANNLASTCTFRVIITANPCYNDMEKPKLTCPNNIVNSTTQNCLTVFWSGPIVTDNCGQPNFSPSTPFRSGECVPIGTNRITYVATDVAGNKDSCSFTVTINKLPNKTVDIDPTIGKILLSPNPTEGVVFLTFESQKAREMTFSVFNYLGIRLWDEKRQIAVGQNRIELNIKELPTGFYIIRPATGYIKHASLNVLKF